MGEDLSRQREKTSTTSLMKISCYLLLVGQQVRLEPSLAERLVFREALCEDSYSYHDWRMTGMLDSTCQIISVGPASLVQHFDDLRKENTSLRPRKSPFQRAFFIGPQKRQVIWIGQMR